MESCYYTPREAAEAERAGSAGGEVVEPAEAR